MKKSIVCAIVFALFLGTAGVAGAAIVPAQWTDDWAPDGGPIDFGRRDYHSYTYQHDLGHAGFDAAHDAVDHYRLSIQLQDDSHHDSWEWAFIDLPGLRTDDAVEVGNHDVHLGWSLAGLASLNANGLLDITIYRLCGDFQLFGSHLSACGTSDPPSQAPIPASLLLMASGLVGLAGYRRWSNRSCA
jgi:hypothetical protein